MKIPDWKCALKFVKDLSPLSTTAEQLENIFESFERFSERHLKSVSPAERASFLISGLEPFKLLIEHVCSLTAEEKKDVALIQKELRGHYAKPKDVEFNTCLNDLCSLPQRALHLTPKALKKEVQDFTKKIETFYPHRSVVSVYTGTGDLETDLELSH
uniref:Uncharacterized protein n=1 Tax=Chromera velia CCMP2878 TaxID=1169474 RepID=A0A0K6S9K6_9ALVE|eukprot:Cvel_7619.t1-p1 / transcript=Cvel_7619.t1 / gene=Cvel_7619 / organism=Chromera_velia_CCMP2878 / gene_product=hypothetical protein / transcript_product=hypothetical protein / location=Cvel_scaffold402:24854-25324(+) / protein_length=157 / sequence_SO=supercontig / SO=protein_coding / is_pseudo=false